MPANINIDHRHDDIMYPQTLPFLLIHAGCVAALWSGVSWTAIAICIVLYGCACLRSVPGTIGTSRIGLTRPAGRFNSFLHFLLKAALRKASSGGLPSIDITIFTQIPSKMCIRPGTRASYTVMLAGSSIASTMPPI